MNKKNIVSVVIFVFLIVVALSVVLCLRQREQKIQPNYAQKKIDENLDKRSLFISDLEKYNKELESRNASDVEVEEMSKYLTYEYYDWAKEKSLKRELKTIHDRQIYWWKREQITGCGEYSSCFQYKVINFDITKDDLSEFMDEYDRTLAHLRIMVLGDLKQTYEETVYIKNENNKDSIEKKKERDFEDFKDSMEKRHEVLAHQIKVLRLVEELDLK